MPRNNYTSGAGFLGPCVVIPRALSSNSSSSRLTEQMASAGTLCHICQQLLFAAVH